MTSQDFEPVAYRKMLEVEDGKCWKYTDLIVEGRSILNDPQEPLYSQATVDQLKHNISDLRKRLNASGHETMTNREMQEKCNALEQRIRDYSDMSSGCPDVLVSRKLLQTMVPASELEAAIRERDHYKDKSTILAEALERLAIGEQHGN